MTMSTAVPAGPGAGAATTPGQITAQALASFGGCPDGRLRQIMDSLVRHLHGFITDVELSEAEWAAAIAALTATGHMTDGRRQEFILWSDALGASMLVDALAHPVPTGATESTVLGPFYVPGSPLRERGASIAMQEAGVPAWVHGRVLDLDGRPVAGAVLDVWQNGDNRLYAVQDPDAPDDHLRGKFRTDDDGSYAFLAVRPVPYTVGQMLAATGRHPWRPAHIHVVVRAPGHQTLTTHIFDAASAHIDDDTVFAVKPSLLRHFTERAAGDPLRPPGVAGPWVSLALDIILPAGPDATPADAGRTH